MNVFLFSVVFAALLGQIFIPVSSAQELRGSFSIENSFFPGEPIDEKQYKNYFSSAVQAEIYFPLNNESQNIVATPFYRWDALDKERTHADFREFYWLYMSGKHELLAGIGKVFWGYTESQHLVDVINQTDLVEDTDGEEKLGQPMVSLKTYLDWGSLEFYLLPYFRERTFPGPNGRLRSIIPIDRNNSTYESKDGENHLDYAARLSFFNSGWDGMISYFYGTNRDPYFQINANPSDNILLVPYYEIMRQVGLAFQKATGTWLFKFESIRRISAEDDFIAATGGFEYTANSVFASRADLGLLLEYMYDDRGQSGLSPFENDMMFGLRYSLNDEATSEFLIAVVRDLETGGQLIRLESSRRLFESLKVSVEGAKFQGFSSEEVLYAFRKDDYVKLQLSYFF